MMRLASVNLVGLTDARGDYTRRGTRNRQKCYNYTARESTNPMAVVNHVSGINSLLTTSLLLETIAICSYHLI